MKTTELIMALLASALLFISVAAGQGSYEYGYAYSNAYAGGMYSDFGYYNASASAYAGVSGSMPPGGMPPGSTYCPGGYCDQTSISTGYSASISGSSQATYNTYNQCGCNPWDIWCNCYPYYSSSYYYSTPSYYYYYTPYYYTPSYYYYYYPAYYYTPSPYYYRYYYYTPSYYYYYTPITWYSYYPTGSLTTTFSYQQSTTIGQGTMMGY